MSDTFLTGMPDGMMNGVRSGLSARMQYNEGTYPYELFYAPKEILFPDELLDMQYVKLRFAMAQRNLTAIHANFVHKTTATIRYLLKHWDLFLSDMESGNVSAVFQLNEKWTAYVKEHLPPDPIRAGELKSLSGHDLAAGLIRKIWPEVKYMRLSSGMQFHPFAEQLDYYSGGIPVYPFLFASSEGMFCVAQGVGKMDSYIMIPDLCFFEFVPEMDEDAPALTLWELKKGERYELVITTVSGLYRYRMGDVVEVVDYMGTTPVISVNYRKSQTLNLAGENLNSVQFENAIDMLFGDQELLAEGNCVASNRKHSLPGYTIFIEGRLSLPENPGHVLDRALMMSCPGYKTARDSGLMHEPEVIRLMPGSFEEFENSFSVSEGRRSEQTKPLKILQTEDQLSFFERRGMR
jgi:hypothetical protein